MRSDTEARETCVIVDGEALSDESIVGQPVERETEQTGLTTCLAPMRRGDRPVNAWLCGPPGSGKTLLTRWEVQSMCSATTAWIGLYVNCWQHRSLYSVLQAIIDDFKILGAEAQDTNVKLGRIQQAFRGRPAVIVLDEIDRPMPAARDAIIYGLLRLPNTGLICVAESTRALVVLDERVRSRLSPVVIEFPPYSANQIRRILKDRARRALMPGSWSPTILRRLAAGAAGDARLAIQGLRHAAAAAEEAGRTTLGARTIEGYLRQWQAIQQEARFMALSEHEKVIQELAAEHAPVGATRLRRLYLAYCRKHGIEPVARRTFSKYLSRLGAAGVLNVAARPTGPGGRLVRNRST